MLKMAMKNTNFVTLLLVLVSYITRLASHSLNDFQTVCDYTEYAADGFADVAHMHRFETSPRLNNPEWYLHGMEHFAYSHNGYKWGKKDLTWGLVKESRDHVLADKVLQAARSAFRQWKWDLKTPFWFSLVEPHEDKPLDIRIKIGKTENKDMLCDTLFPPRKAQGTTMLDDAGVTIVINDALQWDNVPSSPNTGVYNLNFALLYEVSHSLGLGLSTDPDAVMSSANPPRFDTNVDYKLQRDDINGIRDLYCKFLWHKNAAGPSR